MTTTVEALKAVYTALGGDMADTYDDIASGATVGNYSVIPDVVNAIAKIATPSSLPTVAVADEGKVLTVNNAGKWVAAAVPSELPTVSATDNGSVLKVIDGAWGIGEDATE